MQKIQSSSDLEKLKSSLKEKRAKQISPDGKDMVLINVAMATCGIASGAREVYDYLGRELEKRSIPAKVEQTGCMGYCYAEPTIEVTLPGQAPLVFGYVDMAKADMIIEKYIINNELVEGIIPVNYVKLDQ